MQRTSIAIWVIMLLGLLAIFWEIIGITPEDKPIRDVEQIKHQRYISMAEEGVGIFAEPSRSLLCYGRFKYTFICDDNFAYPRAAWDKEENQAKKEM